ncbi:MAG: class I SAM-dependent methyltransferase [Planctomycetaceae bacterium]|nr:class I SAM-dependent methyltransferase [Planctomycetaceae bacterium]
MRRCSQTLEAEMTPSEQIFLQQIIQEENYSGTHLEIGTAAGGTLCKMMGCFDNQSRPKFVVVDRMTYFPNQLDIVKENLATNGLSEQGLEFRTTTSSDAFQIAVEQEDQFDFMLIDASHKILAVMADLRWTRLLNVGGIVCFHDYADKFPGVKLSIDRFLSQHKNYERVGLADTLLAIRKTAPCASPEVSIMDSAYSVMMYLPLEVQRKIGKWKKRKAA